MWSRVRVEYLRKPVRAAAQALDTEAEELYVHACQTFNRRDQNRILETRAKLSRLARELRELINEG
jgi:hypothetical protein